MPVLAIATAPGITDWRDRVGSTEPRTPIPASGSGWYEYAGGSMRLIGVEDVTTGLTDFGGDPYRLPDGLRAWRVTVEFKDPGEKLGGCQVSMEDGEHRVFDPDPSELSGVKKPFGSCLPPFDAPKEALSTGYQSQFMFVLPDGARPLAIRVTLATQIPRYVRLITPG